MGTILLFTCMSAAFEAINPKSRSEIFRVLLSTKSLHDYISTEKKLVEILIISLPSEL